MCEVYRSATIEWLYLSPACHGSRLMDIEKDSHGFYTFISASKRATERGDHQQAERLLKTSLKSAEQHIISLEHAVSTMISDLIELYELQGRVPEANLLQERLIQLSTEDRKNYLEVLKNGKK